MALKQVLEFLTVGTGLEPVTYGFPECITLKLLRVPNTRYVVCFTLLYQLSYPTDIVDMTWNNPRQDPYPHMSILKLSAYKTLSITVRKRFYSLLLALKSMIYSNPTTASLTFL